MDEKRKLATLQKIEKLEVIPGADFILKAKLYNLEWQFVVKKDEFKEGDLCVYFEIDSLLPEKPVFEFMRERKFRVKTIKLKKTISQGICMPVTSFPNLDYLFIGEDLTNNLGVKKYLTPTERNEQLLVKNKKLTFIQRLFGFKQQKKKGSWPKFIQKTDEERIQNMNYSKIYEHFKDKKMKVTEKVDGQSATFFVKNEKKWLFFKNKYFGVCSRNIWLKKEDDSLYWKIARLYNLEQILKSQKNEMIIQGEQSYIGVQDNRYGFSIPRLFIFNIIEIRDNVPYRYDYNEIVDWCEKNSKEYLDYTRKLEIVPLENDNYYLPEKIENLIAYSTGKSKLNPKIDREGIVVRLVENGDKKLSFKVINPDYLLKYE